MVECSPATRAARVRFPADAFLFSYLCHFLMYQLAMKNEECKALQFQYLTIMDVCLKCATVLQHLKNYYGLF